MLARIAVLAAFVVVGSGCGGGDPCAGSRCPNDSRPTQAQYDQCVQRHNADRNNRCYQEGVNYELCVLGNTVCTSGGTTDTSASLSRISTDCRAALDSVVCCSLGLSSCK